jgi:hypothetical protein
MADRNLAQLNYEIGADLSKLDLSINEANRLIKDFAKQAGSSGADGLAKLNKEILRLTEYREGLKQIGLPNDLPNNVKRSTTALTSLNQVVQDLPFGFIGIQNNIPNLVQQFALLTKENNGFRGALSALAGAITGPIGLVAGVSLLTTGLTVLTQKYGSLGNALQAILGSQSAFNKEIQAANKSYESYNESKRNSLQITNQEVASVSANIIEVNTLLKIISDQTKSYDERNAALNRLKEIDKDYFGNLDLEKTKIEDITKAIGIYTASLKQAAITKGFAEGISSTSVELSKQVEILDKLQQERDDIARKPVKFIGKADLPDTRELDAATSRFNEQNKKVNELKNTLSLFNAELDKSIIEENRIKAPIDAANAALKKQEEAAKKAKKFAEDLAKLNKLNAEEALRLQQDRFNREDAAFKVLSEAYISTLTDRKKEEFKINQDYEDKRSTLLRANKFDFSAIEEEVRIKMKEVDDKYNQISLKDAEKAAKERLRIQEEIGKSARNQFESTFIAKKGKSQQEEDAKALEESYLSIGKAIFNNVINPLNQLFDVVLSKGEKSWQDFTASVVESLKKLYARLAAAAAIAGILSLASGGTAAGGVGFFKAFSSILGVNLGGGSVANPSFGGVQPGGMQMAGSVNMVLRGQDLVGSLNRTNSQFSRVG